MGSEQLRQVWDCMTSELRLVNADLLEQQRRHESFDVVFILRQYRDALQKRLDKVTFALCSPRRQHDWDHPASAKTVLRAARARAERESNRLRGEADGLLREAQLRDAEYESLTYTLAILEL